MRMIGAVLLQFLLVPAALGADLKPYVGKGVQNKVNGRTLFEVANVKKNLTAAFGATRYELVAGHEASGSAIAQESDPELGELVISSQCQPHNCPNASTVILTTNAKAIGLCLTDVDETDAEKTVEEWFGSGWTLRKVHDQLGCRFETPSEAIDGFKAARRAAGKGG